MRTSLGRAQMAALLVGGIGAAGGLFAAARQGQSGQVKDRSVGASLSSAEGTLRALPLRFEPNLGQFDSDVKFAARGSGFEVRLSASSADLLLYEPEAKSGSVTVEAVSMRVEGGNPSAKLEGAGELRSVSNYLIGRDPAGWHTGVPNFGAVRYREIYPGIDLLFHGGQGRLEYDFDLAPGADPGAIRLAFDGLDALSLGKDGTLQLAVGAVVLSQPPPGLIRRVAGGREEVAGAYQLLGSREVGFRLERSDSPLLIDPVLIYSTYLGGSVGDQAFAVAVDSAGSAYLAGETVSPDFPTKNPFQGVYRGATGEFALAGNAFVTKFDPSGSSLVYSTYLGGSSGADGGLYGDEATGMAVDDAGHAFVVGSTDSSDFPVTDGGYQLSLEGSLNAFLAELDPSGSNLEYSSYLGGSQLDAAKAVALDGAGKVYVCGSAGSANFPLVQPIDTTPPPAFMNTGFVAGFDTTVSGSAGLFFSTFLGGIGADADAIRVDGLGRVYVSGVGAPPAVIGGADAGVNTGGAFLVRLTDAGTSIDYSRTIAESPGGSNDEATALAIDLSGAAYIAGHTNDLVFPTTPDVVQPSSPHAGGAPGDNLEAFVAKLSADGATWEYATYLGGSDDTSATGIAVNPSCASGCGVTVVGNTRSTDFPTAEPVAAWGDFSNGGDFLSQLDATASTLTFSTPMFMSLAAVAEDSSGNIYGAGESEKQMVLLNPFQAALKANGEAALAKIGATAPGPTVTSVTPSSGTTLGGTPIIVTGGYFGTGTTVRLGGVSATGVQLLSATQLSAITGPAAAGAVYVTVTNLDLQNATLPNGFTYVAPEADDGGDGGPDAGDAGSDGGPDAGDGGQMKADSGPSDSGPPDSGSIEDAGRPDAGSGASSSGCSCGSGGSPGTLLALVIGLAGGLAGRRRRSGS